MSQIRKRPPKKRLIRSRTGLFFKDGGWTAHAHEATVFATISEALRTRQKFGLEDVQLVGPSAQFDLHSHRN